METRENECLISKKALLERYSISYGALYRWKRKGLIPEDWFIKKATVTGQETFFPEALICPRVELILSTKEELLLDDLAAKLSGAAKNDATVVLDTVFGEKKFRIQDIRSVYVISGDGEMTDLTDAVQNIIKKGE